MVPESIAAVIVGGAFVAGVAVTGLWVASPSLPASTRRRRGQTQPVAEFVEDETADDGWHEDDDDPVVPTDAPLTGYQRWHNGVDAAVAMRARRRVMSGEAARLRVSAREIAVNAPGLFAAAYGPTEEIRQVFAEITADAGPSIYDELAGEYWARKDPAARHVLRVAAAAKSRPELRVLSAGGGR